MSKITSSVINLDNIAEPKFTFMAGDKRVELDLWETSSKLEKLMNKVESPTMESTCDCVREAFGFPTSAEVSAPAAEGAEPIKTLSMNQCMVLQTSLGEFIQGLDVSKKAEKLSRK